MKTVHKPDCSRVFKRYDINCPRCAELAAGSEPRKGWGNRRKELDQQRCADIRQHFSSEAHLSGKCGPVCTFGDW